jgi:hypothetical protein
MLCEHEWRYEPARTTLRGGEYGPYRICARCEDGLVLANIPAGHPETVSIAIDEADEEWLASLDAELDPDRTNEEV